MRKDTVPLDHFEQLYAARPDPWHLATSGYEQGKYAATLAALPRQRYAAALEIGCANGVFTEMLSDRCDDLLAIEPVPAALEEARRRNAPRRWVRFAGLFVPAQWPGGSFDLVALSEVIDYLGADDIERLAERVCGALRPAGDMIMVHWVGKKRAGGPAAEEASDRFIAAARGRVAVVRAARNRDYRLDLLRRL